MRKDRKPQPIYPSVEIVDIAAEGKAIAKIDNMIVFIPFVVPGDIVDLQLSRKKKNYAEGKPIRFEKYSDIRTEAFCEHFGVCGGCKWQILPYEEQLRYKQKQVEDNLTRIGKIDLPEIKPILGSEKTTFYRNKLEYTFSNKKWLTWDQVKSGETFDNMNALGFHIPGCFDKVLEINKCWLQEDVSNQLRNFIRDYCYEKEYTFFDLRNRGGLMRTLIIRTSSTGELMVIVVFYDDDKEKHEDVLNAIAEKFPQITSLLYIINQKANDTITDQEVLTWKGNDYIYEEMEGLKFKIGPKSFYQTNSEQAYNLYKITRDFAGLTGDELVYDLYTGTGTIANFVARNARKVVGIEYVEDAIEDAKFNSQNNKIENTLFYAGDMKDILTQDFINEHGKPDVIITDPPRAGMHDNVIEAILFAEPEKVVYVSCNPATQARDLNLLDAKYKVEKVQPVDMFPHTHHVENVVLLIKK
ncbi:MULTISPECIES: 23S rRNA (uracil(1939)-C(5))-methyltransferase RlmD [unclassified Dysgonomonas]|uniref:23S rRNA (uracil(1939)-C(5))-methyltransferase RlmD n=1 Tax=unclassified Dysgonomonas TaxID=2630389 RepID=UPI00067FDA32|nr:MULTISPECIES: 23S rRNA (uracil(1939)-C(5))-methyltransferase RlmD [unclassified Dysgonomonas]MBD8349719.1 23S rRNA (uracil(1939)-C(5))-methyltransferase RlmD [Dysgonomonas sp. HGC4]MBF0577628.1 23S rRNA (uracil(1939)-C(5))-methyltransferase RlmD [Dysgonomonas sp. GY617]